MMWLEAMPKTHDNLEGLRGLERVMERPPSELNAHASSPSGERRGGLQVAGVSNWQPGEAFQKRKSNCSS